MDSMWLSVRLGAQEFAIDIAAVREVRGWTAPTPLPQAPHYVSGMVDLRGDVIPIIDLADRLGLPPAEHTASSVIVVVRIADFLAGLHVDQVCDLVTIAGHTPAPQLRDAACDPSRYLIAGTVSIDGRILHLIRVENVVGADESRDLSSVADPGVNPGFVKPGTAASMA